MEDNEEAKMAGVVTLLLLHAVQNEDELCLNLLLAAGADVNLALIRAAKNGSAKCVNILAKSGADVNACDQSNNTALMCAASSGHYRCMDELINSGADVNALNENTNTTLICAVQGNHLDCAVRLIEAGADVNASPEDNRTALLTAAAYDHSECIELLLAKGADVNKTTKRGHTAVKYAVVLGNYKSLQVLLESGAHVDWEDLELATLSGNFKCVKLLKDSSSFDDEAVTKCVLERGILHGKHDYLPSLTEAGVDVNARDITKYTPLIYAASNGDSENTHSLIEAGADVNAFGAGGLTSLHAATFSADIRTVKLLLAAGADVNKKSYYINALTFTVLRHPHTRMELKTILFAAGEVPDQTIVDKGTITLEKLTLKQLCCNAIRTHLITLDSHSNLFGRIPQLGLSPALTTYMSYNVSLDVDLNLNDIVRKTGFIIPSKVRNAYDNTSGDALLKRRHTTTATRNRRRILRFSSDININYHLKDKAVRFLIVIHCLMLFGVVLTVFVLSALTPPLMDNGPAIVIVLFATAFTFLTSKLALGRCLKNCLLVFASCYGVIFLRLVFQDVLSL